MSNENTKPLKAIFYTDGGYRQNDAAGGWGVHGYTYVDEKPTKGTGNPKAIPTNNGYQGETTKGDPVTITAYIDGIGGVIDAISNNHTELEATTRALEWIHENGVTQSKIYTDSRYVVNGLTDWVNKWKTNGWKNSQGNPMDERSKAMWMKASDLYETLKGKGTEVEVAWIKGHNGHFGNEMADHHASIGNVLGSKRDDYTQFLTTEPSGYWHRKTEYNRMLANGRWYFQTTDEDIKTADGSTVYYIGDHGSDDDLHGKSNSDTAMAVLYLKEPDPVLEKLRQQAIDLDKRKFGSVMIGRLDQILNPTVYAEIDQMGTRFLDYRGRRKDILTAKKRQLVKEKNPPGLAWIAVDASNLLRKRLDSFLAGEHNVIVTEITNLIYDEETKKSSVVKKVKKDITQNTSHITVDVRYSTKRVSELTGPDDTSIAIKPVKLILGQDIAKRNALSNLGANDPKVFVITWRESDEAFRYATVLQCDLGVGIWAGIYSNFLLV